MAREFDDASTQYLEESSSSDVIDGATSLSIAFWYLNDDNASQKPVTQWGGSFGPATFLIEKDTSGKIGLLLTDAAPFNSSSRRLATGIGTGSWNHFVFTWAATDTHVIYINGVSQTIEAWVGHAGIASVATSGSRPKFNIGRAADGGLVDGKIAEVAIWKNVVLNADQALALGNGFSPLFFPIGLVRYFPLIGRTSPEPDLRTGNNVTLVNAPTVFTHPRVIYPSSYNIAPFASTSIISSLVSTRMMMGLG